MSTRQTPQRCRWATPTLYLPLPGWLDAWDSPWSCRREGAPRLIETANECEACPRFEARGEHRFETVLAQVGL